MKSLADSAKMIWLYSLAITGIVHILHQKGINSIAFILNAVPLFIMIVAGSFNAALRLYKWFLSRKKQKMIINAAKEFLND